MRIAGAPSTSAPVIVGLALSPWLGAVLARHGGGYPQLFGLLAGLTMVAAMVAIGTKAPGHGAHERG